VVTSDDRVGLVPLPVLGHIVVQRVVGVGGGQQTLDAQEHCADLESRGPFVLQYINRYLINQVRRKEGQ
jgi:hypothetical protein